MLVGSGYNLTIGFSTEETARSVRKKIAEEFGFVVRILQVEELV